MGKNERKRPLGVYSLKWASDKKRSQKIWWGQDAFYWSLLETNIWFPPNAAHFLSSYAKITFSVRNFPHELVVYVNRGHNGGKSMSGKGQSFRIKHGLQSVRLEHVLPLEWQTEVQTCKKRRVSCFIVTLTFL